MSSKSPRISECRRIRGLVSAILRLSLILAAGSLPNALGINQYACRGLPAPGFEDPSMASFHGEYNNPVYEYGVRIPAGLTGYSSPPPSPAHGFGILLGTNKEGYLWVDGSWNSLEFESSEMAARAVNDYLKKHGAIISESKMEPSRLGELLASRAIVRYTCPDSQDVYVRDEVIGVSANKSKIWEVGLDTPLRSYDQDRQAFEAVLKSWRHRPGNR